MKNKDRGFTLVEFIILAAIVSILAAIAIPKIASIVSMKKFPEIRRSIENIIGGDHTLRKMTEKTAGEGQINGSFFLFGGSLNSESKSYTSITFAWLMNDKKAYQINTIPINKVKVIFGEVDIPTIQFKTSLKNSQDNTIYLKFLDEQYLQSHIQEILDTALDEVLITCKEDDWKPNVQLPLN